MRSENEVMLEVLGIVDSVVYARDDEHEAVLSQAWRDLNPTPANFCMIASRLRAYFGVSFNWRDPELFGMDVTLDHLCGEIALRMEVTA